MVTKHELAAMLRQVPVLSVAREAGVSPKTIYRLRHMKHSPTLDTVETILAALDRLERKRVKEARKTAVAA